MVTPSTKDEAATGDLAPQTMNLTDRTARRQRASSIQSDSDPTSSSGSSSEEDSDSDNDDDEHHSDHGMDGTGESSAQQAADSIPQIGGRPKPRIRRFEGNSDIMSRLTSFLPQMKTANEDLQKQIDAGNADDLVLDNADGNGERYIEMDLGLGVLEEKRDGDSSDESDDEGAKDEQDDSDIIGKLMGGKRDKPEGDKPSIQEMAE